MLIKKIFIVLFIILASTFFLCFWQSGNAATPVIQEKVSIQERTSTPSKAELKEIAKQLSQLDDPSIPVVEPKSHPATFPELEGEIHNEYQIRDDILETIEEMTKDNQRARRAAIKYAYYENQAYYHSLTVDEALAWDKKSALAGWCLVMADDEKWHAIYRKISEMMDEPGKRKLHIRDIDSNFFSGKILGSGLTEVEETEKCKSGVF